MVFKRLWCYDDQGTHVFDALISWTFFSNGCLAGTVVDVVEDVYCSLAVNRHLSPLFAYHGRQKPLTCPESNWNSTRVFDPLEGLMKTRGC